MDAPGFRDNVGHFQFAHRGPRLRCGACRRLQRGRACGLGLTGKLLRHDPDARAFKRWREQFGPIGHRRQAERDALDIGREQADGVERPGKTFDPDGRQQPVRRLDRGRAAERGRPDHRSAGLRAQCERDHAAPDGCSRARRRSARRVAMIVRIECRRRVVCRERRGRGLAHDGGAGLLQQHHHRGIRARLVAAIDFRTHLGRHVLGVDDVLDADGNAAQRAVSLRARIFGAMGKGADGRLEGVDGGERLVQRRVRRQLALVDTALLVGERDHVPPVARFCLTYA